MSEVLIRQAKTADKEAIARLLDKMQNFQVSIDPTSRLQRLEGYGEDELKSVEIVYVAEFEGKIVGCVCGNVKEYSDSTKLWMKPHKVGVVEDLYVLEEYRGKGIGNRLMTKIEMVFAENDCRYTEVEVMAENKPAKKLYERLGYKEGTSNRIKQLATSPETVDSDVEKRVEKSFKDLKEGKYMKARTKKELFNQLDSDD